LSRRDLRHDYPRLLRKIHGSANEDHRFNPIRLQRRHVKKNVATHAQANCPAFADAEMIEQAQRVQRTLAMGNRIARIGAPTVAARVGFDDGIFTDELVATGVGPVFLAACAAMQKQERFPAPSIS
jgi:hypothetical protein